jgi:hypothetical protein
VSKFANIVEQVSVDVDNEIKRNREEGSHQEEIYLINTEIRNSVFCSSDNLLKEIDAISPESRF